MIMHEMPADVVVQWLLGRAVEAWRSSGDKIAQEAHTEAYRQAVRWSVEAVHEAWTTLTLHRPLQQSAQ